MRDALKKQFLQQHGWGEAVVFPIQGDASFRSYARLSLEEKYAILMDAPPGKEDIAPFIMVANYLSSHNLAAPEIIASDTINGFMLLEDFGDNSYSKVLAGKAVLKEEYTEVTLYEQAIDALATLHSLPLPNTFPLYDEALLLTEAMLMLEWYFPVLNGEKLPQALEDEYIQIWKQLLPYLNALSSVVVLRDYHADNLMWLPERKGVKKVGLLDFQDAVIGSPAYDMVSLLEDARRDVQAETVSLMINRYLAAVPSINRKNFLAAYAILGAQRNCKIVGIFSRLSARDGNPAYLKLLPRVWQHIMHDIQHPLLQPLKKWFERVGILEREKSA